MTPPQNTSAPTQPTSKPEQNWGQQTRETVQGGQNSGAQSMNQGMPQQGMGQSMGQTVAQSTGQGMGQFSAEEWNTLVNTPLKVGQAVMFASHTGLGAVIGLAQEAMAMGKALQELSSQGSSSALLNTLGQQVKGMIQSAQSGGANPFADATQDPAAARQQALMAIQQASAILRKASPQDASAYKQYVFDLARKVAEAAKEGGFMGIGGQAISAEEDAILRELSNALRS